MYAAGVVTNHAAEGAAAVRRRIRGKSKFVALGLSAQRVKDDARLHACAPGDWIERKDGVQMLGKVDDYGNVAALASQTCASSARQNRCVEFTACCNGGNNVVNGERHHKTDGNLAIVRCIGRVECA